MSSPQVSWLAQYRVVLPADYDMETIRRRVRTRGAALDDRQGLALKAYAVRERGVDGSPVNEYAPFYFWQSAAAMGEFHWGGTGFAGIVQDFGRPPVRTWVPVAVARGGAERQAVHWATVVTSSLGEGADLVSAAAGLARRVASWAGDESVHWAGVGIDPSRWETVEFITWTERRRTSPDAALYRVLHLSEPTSSSPSALPVASEIRAEGTATPSDATG